MNAKKKQGFFRLLELAGEKKTLMVVCGILSTVSAFFMLVPYLAVYNVMAELLRKVHAVSAIDGSRLIIWALRGIGGMALGYLFMYLGGMAGHIAAYRTLYGIRVRVSDHLGRLPLGYFNKNSIGKNKQIMETDIEQIELFIAHQLPDLINTAAMLIAMIVVMFYFNPILALACIIPIIAGFMAQFSMMFGKKMKEGLSEFYDALEDINTSATQYVRGMPSIKIFGQTIYSFRKFYNDVIKYRDFSMKYALNFENSFATYRTLVFSLSTFILPAGLFFFTGAPQNISFALTLIFFLIIAPGVSMQVLKLNNLAMTLTTLSEAAKRVDSIMEEKPIEEPAVGMMVPPDKDRTSFDITFNNVTFSYTEGNEILKGISFAAPQNSITALVGPSGSGKSTIAHLIPRFWDVQGGSIAIGGVDIRKLRTEELMDTMSFVFQNSFLFSDTVYNNILAGRPAAAKEEIYAAAKAAQCHDFILGLPNGYDTLIGEGGIHLSGGEEQRVCVARAILKNAPILVLDEATAYADPENEYQMQLALGELIKNKTTIIIAHHLRTIQEANKIIVINDGRIIDQGSHGELLSHEGLYKKMWDASLLSTDWQLEYSKTEGVSL
ncbi:MAG: ABC transporter ATP-binding protein/permease [Treponema sp.]|nr:ABC transporter ATP-binding protein/permease [Treponema sp.]